MQPDDQGLSVSALVALASEQLASNGYRVVRDTSLSAFPGDRALLAEDEYSVVAIVAYDSWGQLEAEWQDAQSELVGLLGRRLARSAPKAYDGYLTLLCTGLAPDHSAVALIERDTTRVRKIVATADMLKTTTDVARVLDIFMPLSPASENEAMTDVLDLLPDLMQDDVPKSAVQVVIDAFRALDPPLERLHELENSP